ncbi:hypothetical protein MCOR14_006632 [Pyricularia oryzae]|nr:hypothetical protein MCOR14_006632 [Pyricularia oryzae]
MQPKNVFVIATLMQMVIGAPVTLSEGVAGLEEPRDAAAVQTDGNPHGLLKRTLGRQIAGKVDLGDACVAGGTAVLCAEAYVGSRMYKAEKEHQSQVELQEQQFEAATGRGKPAGEKAQVRTGSSGSSYPPWSSA